MSDEAVVWYGECYRGRQLTVEVVSWKYMPAEEFYKKGKPFGFHPRYDEGCGSCLYDFEEVEFALYDWEIV